MNQGQSWEKARLNTEEPKQMLKKMWEKARLNTKKKPILTAEEEALYLSDDFYKKALEDPDFQEKAFEIEWKIFKGYFLPEMIENTTNQMNLMRGLRKKEKQPFKLFGPINFKKKKHG